MLPRRLAQSAAPAVIGIALLCAPQVSSAPPLPDLPPLPPPDPVTTELNQLDEEASRISQEARDLGGGRTIAESASNVRNSFYENRAHADELERLAEDMGYTRDQLRAEQRRIAQSGSISLGDLGKGAAGQVVDKAAEEGIKRYASLVWSRVFGALSLAKDCYQGTKAIKLWILTRQQAGSLGDSADSVRRNWFLLNDMLIALHGEAALDAGKMRRLEEIGQRYRAIQDRIAELRQPARRATGDAVRDRNTDSAYDHLIDRIRQLQFERKIADLQGNEREVRRLDAEIAPLEQKAREAEAVPSQGRIGARPFNRTAAALLDYHNGLRLAMGSPPLVWSDTLTMNARPWAQMLASTGVIGHSPRSSRPANERENISVGVRGASSAMKMARLWGSEAQWFTNGVFPNVCMGEWSMCAHISQMLWSETTEVGCWFAQGQMYEALVCRYSPPGNQDGKPVIRLGLTYEFAGGSCKPVYQETNVPQPSLPNKEAFKPVQPTKIDGPIF